MLHPSAYHMRTSFITPWCDNVIFSTQHFNTSFYFILKTSKFNHTASSYTNQILYSFIILYIARDTTVLVSLENKMQAVREVAFGLSAIQYVSDILWMHENAWVMNSRWRHQSIHIYVRTHFFPQCVWIIRGRLTVGCWPWPGTRVRFKCQPLHHQKLPMAITGRFNGFAVLFLICWNG